MKYRGLLLDIDNTLYNYNTAHSIAKSNVIDYCTKNFKMSSDEIICAYETGRKKVHIELSETAASHNRLLYFQKMCELLKVNPLKHSLDIYNIYWDTFLNTMQPFENMHTLLEKYSGKICLVTDLTAHIQYRKIQKLNLDNYCTQIVTSEEAGREKPHPYVFIMALQKLNLQTNEVCMIGDSYKKDVLGAYNSNIDAIWFNHENKEAVIDNKAIKTVTHFNEIIELI